jgi:hypothetical protein
VIDVALVHADAIKRTTTHDRFIFDR